MNGPFTRAAVANGLATVWIERPPANALEIDSIRQLRSTVDVLRDDPAVRAVILTGAGPCFSAGLDLKVVPHYDRDRQRELLMGISTLVETLYGFPKPTVAAINGHAVAAGTLLALTCDTRIGPTGDCRFGFTGTRVGIPYPLAALEIVKGELPPPAVRRCLLGARTFGAEDALDMGVLDERVASTHVLDRAEAVARDLASMPATVYQRVKLQLRGDCLERMRATIDAAADPLLATWMDTDALTSIATHRDRPDDRADA